MILLMELLPYACGVFGQDEIILNTTVKQIMSEREYYFQWLKSYLKQYFILVKKGYGTYDDV